MLYRWFREFHPSLIFATLGLICMGTLFVYSASHHDSSAYLTRQIFWVIVSLGVLFIVQNFGYRTFLSMANLFYIFSILLLIWVLIAGATRLGAQRWITLGPLVIQPSEFAKLATVLTLANYLGNHQPWEHSTKNILWAIAVALLPFLLIVKQPDLGSALVFLPALAAVLFIWGIRKRIFIFSFILILVSTPIFWHFLKPYQKKRIHVFMDPMQDPLGAGYTALQSRIAVGSGGLWGKGYLEGTQSQLDFVPEHHTDFIFCVIGEEWGFIGSLILLALYWLLFKAALTVMDQTTDIKAKLLITGFLATIFTQVFINIGMSFGLMPIAGITLPLVSYGGSSMVATTFSLGMIMSIYKERSIF